MHHEFGAHEIMEAHEVMTGIIDGINTFELYRQHVNDQHLMHIIDKQVNFMEKEYNDMVSYLTNHRGVTPDVYHSRSNTSIKYGLRNPSPVSPQDNTRRLNDRDAASALMCWAKCGAAAKMRAALECADPQLRHMIMQGAVSCAEQSYEIFTYMNQKGLYQVPTMQQRTQNTFTNTFQPTGINQGAGYTPGTGYTTGTTVHGTPAGTGAAYGVNDYSTGLQGQIRQQ